MAKKEFLLNILLTFLFIAILTNFISQNQKNTNDSSSDFSFDWNYNLLLAHSPILIDSNNDFLSYSSQGNGSQVNPYIIEHYQIEAYNQTPGVRVHGTSAHFIIRNCTITADYIAIFIESITSNTCQVINNTCISRFGDGGGICFGVNNATIKNNIIKNFMQGIHFNYASNCHIIGNSILNSNYQGINIRYSNYNLIKNNSIINTSQHGIALVGSSHSNIIHHNTLINNSKVENYTIDGEREGIIHSQGYDEGSNNQWCDEGSKYGNCWSDWSGKGTYSIDGTAGAIDPYPFGEHCTKNSSILISPLLIVISLVIYKKAIKK